MSRAIPTCECVEVVNEKLAEHNACLLLPIFGPRRVFVETGKLDEKKRGKPPAMFASYCPFCGVKYEVSP